MRRRDGTQLEVYGSPRPSAEEYNVQRIDVDCMADGSDHICEKHLDWDAYGTLLTPPKHCGLDILHRVVFFIGFDSKLLHPLG